MGMGALSAKRWLLSGPRFFTNHVLLPIRRSELPAEAGLTAPPILLYRPSLLKQAPRPKWELLAAAAAVVVVAEQTHGCVGTLDEKDSSFSALVNFANSTGNASHVRFLGRCFL
nr:hypothetical protein Iba_chr07dCG7860 [Ipomoea batatas]